MAAPNSHVGTRLRSAFGFIGDTLVGFVPAVALVGKHDQHLVKPQVKLKPNTRHTMSNSCMFSKRSSLSHTLAKKEGWSVQEGTKRTWVDHFPSFAMACIVGYADGPFIDRAVALLSSSRLPCVLALMTCVIPIPLLPHRPPFGHNFGIRQTR